MASLWQLYFFDTDRWYMLLNKFEPLFEPIANSLKQTCFSQFLIVSVINYTFWLPYLQNLLNRLAHPISLSAGKFFYALSSRISHN